MNNVRFMSPDKKFVLVVSLQDCLEAIRDEYIEQMSDEEADLLAGIVNLASSDPAFFPAWSAHHLRLSETTDRDPTPYLDAIADFSGKLASIRGQERIDFEAWRRANPIKERPAIIPAGYVKQL